MNFSNQARRIHPLAARSSASAQNAADSGTFCARCNEQGIEALATEKRWDEDFCENCAQSEDEAAYERMLDSFYGGSGPATIQERYDEASALKRSQR